MAHTNTSDPIPSKPISFHENELAIIQNTIDAIAFQTAVVSPAGIILAVNKSWVEFGRDNNHHIGTDPHNSTIGANYFEVLQNSRGEEAAQAHEALNGIMLVLRGQLPEYKLEYPCHSPSEQRWFMMSVLPFGAKERGIVITHQNTTSTRLLKDQQKDMEVLAGRLSFEKKQLDQIIKRSPGGLYTLLVSPDGTNQLVYASAKFEALTGISAEQLKKDPGLFYKIIHPDDLPMVLEANRVASSEVKQWHESFRINHPNGNLAWIEIVGRPFQEADGSILWFGIVIDVTKRKREEAAHQEAERLLLESEIKYRTLTHNISTPFASLSGEGVFVFVNEPFARIFGRTPDEMLGRHLVDAVGREVGEERMSIIKKVITENKKYSDELMMIVDGQKRYYQRSFQPVVINGKIDQVLIMGVDVTDQKLEAERQARYTQELEQRVIERTKELEQALGKAQELVELKNKFVNMASHEFRTPLATISLTSGFIRRYRDKLDSAATKEKIDLIEQQVRHMSGLLDDILTIGRSEAGRVKVNYTRFPLKPFIEGIAHEVEAVRKTHAIRTKFECSQEWVTTDEKMIRHIIINLLTNAIKFSPARNAVDFSTRCDESNLEFTIQDYGIGIPKKDQPELFQPFFRGNNTVNIQGTGLGLSIVKKSVESLNGTLQFESEEGKGSTFCISLPLVP